MSLLRSPFGVSLLRFPSGFAVLRSLSALFLSAFLVLAASAADARQMISIDRPEVNMRSGPGTRHATLWTLSRGYPLAVVGQQGQWYKVRDFENDEGWVYRPLTAKKPHVVVKSRIVNLRSGPGTRHALLGKAQYGEVLRTLGHRADWVRVRTTEGKTGWIARRLVWGW